MCLVAQSRQMECRVVVKSTFFGSKSLLRPRVQEVRLNEGSTTKLVELILDQFLEPGPGVRS